MSEGHGLEVGVARIEGRTRRGQWTAVAWIGSLVALVAVAILGRSGDGPARTAPDPPSAERAAPALGVPMVREVRVVLSQPRRLEQVVAGEVRVSGFVDGGARDVHVLVQDEDGRVLASAHGAAIAPGRADRPVHARFDLVVDVPNPPLDGDMWLHVVAYESSGVATAAMTRRVEVGPMVAEPERTSGEDGLMGSLVLDPRPRYPFVLWWPVGKLGWTTNPAQS